MTIISKLGALAIAVVMSCGSLLAQPTLKAEVWRAQQKGEGSCAFCMATSSDKTLFDCNESNKGIDIGYEIAYSTTWLIPKETLDRECLEKLQARFPNTSGKISYNVVYYNFSGTTAADRKTMGSSMVIMQHESSKTDCTVGPGKKYMAGFGDDHVQAAKVASAKLDAVGYKTHTANTSKYQGDITNVGIQ